MLAVLRAGRGAGEKKAVRYMDWSSLLILCRLFYGQEDDRKKQGRSKPGLNFASKFCLRCFTGEKRSWREHGNTWQGLTASFATSFTDEKRSRIDSACFVLCVQNAYSWEGITACFVPGDLRAERGAGEDMTVHNGAWLLLLVLCHFFYGWDELDRTRLL